MAELTDDKETKSPLISIIMPVYNSEKYIGNAINSILNQTYSNFELILIDDGSSDSSGLICDQYENQDARVRCVHQENQGICAARNGGILGSKGEYITFCDNDDEYLPNFLEDNIKIAVEQQADLVKFGKKIVYIENNTVISEDDECFQKLATEYSQNDIQQCFSQLDRMGCFMFVWDGIYSRRLLHQNGSLHMFSLNYKSGYEDFDFNYRLVKNVDMMVINQQTYYIHYMRTSSSTSLKYTDNKLDSLIRIMNMKDDLIWNYYHPMEMREADPFILEDIGEKASGVVSLLSAKRCKLSIKEKVHHLKEISNLKSTRINFTDAAKQLARQYNKSRYVIWQLLREDHLCTLLMMGWIKKRILDRIDHKGYKIS